MPHPLPPCLSVYAPNRRLPLASRPELGDGGNMRPVVDLLVEQIECADFILLNKV
jgi:G3E family GTPase